MNIDHTPDRTMEPHCANLPTWALPALPRHPLRIVLDNVRSAYNVGALFRTADAAAVDRMILLGFTPHPPHHALEKTALGASRYVPWEHHLDAKNLAEDLAIDGYQLVGLENSPDAEDLETFRWPNKVALVAGNEVEGITDTVLAQCPRKVRIPMYGYKASLNVTTALGLAMFRFIASYRSSGDDET